MNLNISDRNEADLMFYQNSLLKDEIERLRGALGRSPCPYPIQQVEEKTATACVSAGVCGCENRTILSLERQEKTDD